KVTFNGGTAGSGGSASTWITWSGQRSTYVGNLAFTGGSGVTMFAAPSSPCQWSTFENIGVSGVASVFGTRGVKVLNTPILIKCFWNINNGTGYCDANFGGSDSTFWQDGCLWDSHYLKDNNANMSSNGGAYHLVFDSQSKSTLGPIYMTCQAMGGILMQNGA